MNHTARAVIIIACALFGAWVSVTVFPPILSNLYENLKSIEENSNPNNRPLVTLPPGFNSKPQEPATTGSEGQSAEGTVADPPNTPETETTGETTTGQPTTGETTSGPVSPNPAGTETPENDRKPAIALSDAVDPGVNTVRVNVPALALLGLICGAALGSLLLRQLDDWGTKWEKMAPGDRVTVFLGSFLGVVAGIIVSLPFQVAFQGKSEGAIITLGLIVGCGAASVYILRTMSDVLPWETTVQAKKRSGIKVFDTNVLIDGRIYDLVRTGFIDGEIYVPNFVLLELQHIADSADSLRRQRGRRGLDVLKRIQSEFEVTVGIHDKYAGAEKDEVDTRLVRLAKAIGGDLVSNDYNLNKVATIQEVRVLNINELALALRPTILPGETIEVTVVKEGNQYGQGVGYLDDGTMVVVEHGFPYIGETIVVPVSQVIQTERGKMIFADASEDNEDEPPANPATRRPRPRK